MPKYVYFCGGCTTEQEVFHGMMEDLDHCPKCNSMDLHRTPQMVHIKRNEVQEDNDAGRNVKRAIEENRAILKDEKKIRVEYKDGN
jgi:putative FmdB family regulatory protein